MATALPQLVITSSQGLNVSLWETNVKWAAYQTTTTTHSVIDHQQSRPGPEATLYRDHDVRRRVEVRSFRPGAISARTSSYRRNDHNCRTTVLVLHFPRSRVRVSVALSARTPFGPVCPFQLPSLQSCNRAPRSELGTRTFRYSEA